jgi:hypothetical protein
MNDLNPLRSNKSRRIDDLRKLQRTDRDRVKRNSELYRDI